MPKKKKIRAIESDSEGAEVDSKHSHDFLATLLPKEEDLKDVTISLNVQGKKKSYFIQPLEDGCSYALCPKLKRSDLETINQQLLKLSPYHPENPKANAEYFQKYTQATTTPKIYTGNRKEIVLALRLQQMIHNQYPGWKYQQPFKAYKGLPSIQAAYQRGMFLGQNAPKMNTSSEAKAEKQPEKKDDGKLDLKHSEPKSKSKKKKKKDGTSSAAEAAAVPFSSASAAAAASASGAVESVSLAASRVAKSKKKAIATRPLVRDLIRDPMSDIPKRRRSSRL